VFHLFPFILCHNSNLTLRDLKIKTTAQTAINYYTQYTRYHDILKNHHLNNLAKGLNLPISGNPLKGWKKIVPRLSFQLMQYYI